MKRALLPALLIAVAAGARAFEIQYVQEEIPEAGMTTRTKISDGKTHFSFIAAPNWTPSSDPSNHRISFQSPAPQVAINIQISTNAIPASAAQFKEQMLPKLKDPVIMDEFTAASGGGAG